MIAERLASIRRRIAEAAARSARSAADVRLIAVSKTFPIERVREAYAAGQREFGENRVQEALHKIAQGSDMDIRGHLIGHLQSNKVRKAAEHCAVVHSVDSADLLRRLEAAAAASSTSRSRSTLSMEWMKAQVSAAFRALFDCR